MKNITKLLLVLSTVAMAKEVGVDLKIGANAGLYKDMAKYSQVVVYNENALLYKTYSSFKNLGGEVYVKAIKDLKVKEKLGVDIKVGGGLSLEVSDAPRLNEGFVNKTASSPSFPTRAVNASDFLDECQNDNSCKLYDRLVEISTNDNGANENEKYKKESDEGTKKFIEIAKEKKHFHLSAYGSLEVSKEVMKDVRVYGALDLGVSSILNKDVEHTFRFGGDKYQDKFTLDRNRISPKVKTSFGVNYKFLDVEVGVGYPGVVNLGVGARLGF
ncbi:hypothetical protein HP397_06055 [Streptobacillus felis]|uniref:Uncharacterized protein n=1 Tax=Streptobacillus felis TaxID=1384509 RepID=A0A7Z0PFZ8_9FUSO|nr:hypothetical protein [Streptobacillus felis]NYV28364.1 hypothetical protein [Streptobacillus felis]